MFSHGSKIPAYKILKILSFNSLSTTLSRGKPYIAVVELGADENLLCGDTLFQRKYKAKISIKSILLDRDTSKSISVACLHLTHIDGDKTIPCPNRTREQSSVLRKIMQ